MEGEGFLRYDLVSTDTDNGRTKWFSFLDTGWFWLFQRIWFCFSSGFGFGSGFLRIRVQGLKGFWILLVLFRVWISLLRIWIFRSCWYKDAMLFAAKETISIAGIVPSMNGGKTKIGRTGPALWPLKKEPNTQRSLFKVAVISILLAVFFRLIEQTRLYGLT